MKTSHEHVDRAVRSLLLLVSRCTPEHQPAPQVLEALSRLLEAHRADTPAVDLDARLEKLMERVERVENRTTLGGVLGKAAMR